MHKKSFKIQISQPTYVMERSSACPRNATLQPLSIYFKILNKHLYYVVDHVRKCIQIYIPIQEIIYVSLIKCID